MVKYHFHHAVPSEPSFWGVLINPIARKAMWCICVGHIQLWAVAVCKLPSQTKVATMPTNIRPIITEILVDSGLGLSQMEMTRITGVPKGAYLKLPHCLWGNWVNQHTRERRLNGTNVMFDHKICQKVFGCLLDIVRGQKYWHWHRFWPAVR